MAFVRWRGNCAELLATVYDQGRSRRLRLAHLVEMRVTPELRAEVAARFPGVRVDWDAVDVALARGSPAEQAERAAHDWPEDRLEWCHLQRHLQYWAALGEARQPPSATGAVPPRSSSRPSPIRAGTRSPTAPTRARSAARPTRDGRRSRPRTRGQGEHMAGPSPPSRACGVLPPAAERGTGRGEGASPRTPFPGRALTLCSGRGQGPGPVASHAARWTRRRLRARKTGRPSAGPGQDPRPCGAYHRSPSGGGSPLHHRPMPITCPGPAPRVNHCVHPGDRHARIQ